MSECFPPIPIYIVMGIILAMFTTVTSNVRSVKGDHGNVDRDNKGNIYFALFLLSILAIPSVTLLVELVRIWCLGLCSSAPDHLMVCYGDRTVVPHTAVKAPRWILGFHAATIAPLVFGAALWFWKRSDISPLRKFESP